MKPFFAIVYELCLDGACVAKDDPLYETSYIGQTGRNASSPEEALETRWHWHKQHAKNYPKECGLKWALQKYGPEAFSKRVICFLKFASRCVDALEWMNAVEMEEIDCRGGVMRDIDPPSAVFQTFNLTIGGQGDPFVRFKALQAEAERVWSRFQRELLSYIEEFGTAYVRNEYVSPSGYKLHQSIHNIRSKRTFLLGENAKERTDWLNTLPGWTWNAVAEGRRLTGAATSKRRNDPVQDAPRRAKKAETLKRKREEHWATLNEVELAEEKYRFERELKYTARKQARREAKARGEVPEPKKSPKRRTESQIRGYEKVKADLAALRATLVPKAQQNQLARLRQDGTVAKAHQVLRESGRGYEVVEEKKPPKPGQKEDALRSGRKTRADLAALRETLVPKAQRHQLPGFRKDGTVAKAYQILRDSGRVFDVVEDMRRPKMTNEVKIRSYERVKADLAALKATLVPEAKMDQVSRYRKDGTVAKARQILREAGRGDEVVEEKKPPLTIAEQSLRGGEKRRADLAALRETLVPKAQRHQLSGYRQDGTVAKAHQILRERSVEAGV